MFNTSRSQLFVVTSLVFGLLSSEALAARKSRKSLRKPSGDSVGEYAADLPMIKQSTPPKGNVEVTAFAGTGFVDVGAGMNVLVRIIDHGFIKSINNSVAIEGGYNFDKSTMSVFGVSHTTHSFGGGPRWQFHVAKPFTAFAGIDLGMENRSIAYDDDYLWMDKSETNSTAFDWGAVLGANWHFSGAFALKLFHNTFYGTTNVGLALKI